MCIICNCGDEGDQFLTAFEDARSGIKASKTAMLKCSKAAADPAARERYDAIHKKIARLLREWNAIEHEREQSDGHTPRLVSASEVIRRSAEDPRRAQHIAAARLRWRHVGIGGHK